MKTKQKLYNCIRGIVAELKFLKYDPTGESSRSLWVFNFENEVLDECIKELVNQSPDRFIPALRSVTIDADDIVKGNYPEELPIIKRRAAVVFLSDPEPTDLIEKVGYGILYIRNITKENYGQLSRNFTYGLSKHHFLNGNLMSHHWLIVGGVPQGNVDIDIAGFFSVIDKEALSE